MIWCAHIFSVDQWNITLISIRCDYKCKIQHFTRLPLFIIINRSKHFLILYSLNPLICTVDICFIHKKTSYHLAGFHCIFKTTYMLTFPENHSSCNSWSSPHPISNSQLHVLPHFHLCPIYLVVFKGVYFFRMGYLILRGASRLDAFSVYPFRAWLLGRRLGSLTDAPAARPSRSSRTKDSSSQISYAHAG